MSAGTASSRGFRCRSLVQQFVGPAFQDAAVEVRGQLPTLSVHHQPQVQAPMALPHAEGLAQQRDRPSHAYPPDEGHAPRRQRLPLRRHHEVPRQFAQSQTPAVLRGRFAAQARVDVLRVDGLLQPCQFPPQVARSPEAALKQRLLEPAVEVLHAAVELRLPFGDEDRADAVAQAQPEHPRQGACAASPAAQLAGIVELDLLRQAQILPAFAEEPQDLVHAAGVGQTQADSAVEDVLAYPDVVAVAAALEVDRSDQIDLLEFVGGPCLGAGPQLTGQQRGEANPWRGQAIALQDALDGAFGRERVDAESLEFSEDGRGPDQAVAGGRRSVGLEPTADGEDGPFQFRWDALGEVVVGPGAIIEPVRTGLQVATPPLVEPGFGTAQDRTDVLDGPAGEAQTDGALTRREFVVHEILRGATAGGCPRGTL